MENQQPDVTGLLPAPAGGWQAELPDQFFDRHNLYDYIDGGAELYLSYGFAALANRTYSRPGQPDIILDIFDMGDSRNAFGVFSHARETIDTTFGQGSQYNPGLLLFWKDRYFISLLGSPVTNESQKFMFALAREIEKSIPQTGELPALLSLLPQQSLVKESVKFFHHYIWLNTYHFIADHNLLHINEKTDAVLAKYADGAGRALLLLLNYRDAQTADSARTDFIREYLPEYSGNGAVQLEDSTWADCRQRGSLLIIVLNASGAGITGGLIREVRQKAEAPQNQQILK
ncbi:MAG: hypothetical protein P8184_12595 [Calditrichia bacterium]